jgi:thioesterase domain-containing protein
LSQHPGIQEAVVLLHEDIPGEKRLVAYLLGESTSVPTVQALRSFAHTKLPAHMVPAAFVYLDAWPLTPNGKVDRRALPVPEPTRPALDTTCVAPRDALERQLVQIWESLLAVQPIGVHDNFFDLGGHSLLAVRVCAQMEKLCSISLPLALLFQAPTIAQLAPLLRVPQSLPASQPLAFRSGGGKPPFFSVSFGGRRLASCVADDQPWYGFYPSSLNGHRPPRTVEAMAAEYLANMRTLQPQGPYFLGGYSFGGLVAFEMAHQLRQQGQEVALLLLVDPTDWRPTRPGQRRVRRYLKEVGRKLVWMAAELSLGLGYRIPLRLRQPYTMAISLWAARAYTPQVYPGRLVLFHTTQRGVAVESAWGPLAAKGFELYDIPGDHFSMLVQPHIQVFLEQWTACLRQAQEATRL